MLGNILSNAISSLREQLVSPQRQGNRGGKGKGGGKNRGFKNEPRALPRSRAVGGMRGKDERDEEFDARMNRAVPRGARSGKGGGLDEQLFLQEGYTPEAARLKANILRSEGGEAFRAEDGSIQTRGAGQRKEVTSSTGRAYDPIRERQELMQRGREAVAAKREAQKADKKLDVIQGMKSRIPGTVTGFANEKGWGERKTLTPEQFANRPAATVTEGRNFPVTNKMTDVIDWMKKDQKQMPVFKR